MTVASPGRAGMRVGRRPRARRRDLLGVNFIVIDIGLGPPRVVPALFVTLRFGQAASPAICSCPADVRYRAVLAVALFICVRESGLLLVAMTRD